jgi:hypothetical protein
MHCWAQLVVNMIYKYTVYGRVDSMWKNERAVPNISALQRLVTFLWILFDLCTMYSDG